MNVDYPLAISYPAHETNYRSGPNTPRGFVNHTPEEPADDRPYTPEFFAEPNRDASTTYFVAFTGRVYQCVRESEMAIANGVIGKSYPAWADSTRSLNRQTISVEIEGYAASIQDTLKVGGLQWRALVALIRHRCTYHRIPLDREHIIGHYQVASNRSDPGATFPWEALIRDVHGGTMDDDTRAAFAEVLRQLGDLGKKLDTQKLELGGIVWNQGKQIVALSERLRALEPGDT